MIKDIGSLYEKMTSYSFKDVTSDHILIEYHRLMDEAQKTLNQKEYRSVKAVHIRNIGALLWDKIESEQPNVTKQFRQITDNTLEHLYSDFLAKMNKIIELEEKEYKVSSSEIIDSLMGELQNKIANLLGIYLPNPLMQEYRRKLVSMVQQLRQDNFVKKRLDLGVKQVQWKFMCEYFIEKVITDETIPFDKKLLKSDVAINNIIFLYARRIRKLGDFHEYMEMRLNCANDNMSTKLTSEEIKADWKKDKVTKEHVLNFVKSVDEGKFYNEELCFIAFSTFISLIPFYNKKTIFNSQYNPIDRFCIYRFVYKLRKFASDSITYRFVNWRNFLIFESCLGYYLDSNKLAEFGLPAKSTMNTLHCVRSALTDKALEEALGKEYTFLTKHASTIKNSFFIENLTPDRKSPSVIICVSGYLSEEDVSVAQWEGVISSINEEALIAYKWPAKTQLNLGKKLAENLLPRIVGINKESIIKTVLEGIKSINTTVFDDYEEASQRAKLAGKLLALMLSMRKLFGDNTIINLMGFSLGTKVIAECIKTLYKLKVKNVICNVFLFGGAASFSNEEAWKNQLTAIQGRIVNCYSKGDWILQALSGVKHKNPIGIRMIFADAKSKLKNRKVENYDATNIVGGHLKYREVFQPLLQQFYP